MIGPPESSPHLNEDVRQHFQKTLGCREGFTHPDLLGLSGLQYWVYSVKAGNNSRPLEMYSAHGGRGTLSQTRPF